MSTDRVLASPNRMVWELFEALRRLCIRVREAESTQDTSALRQDAALCVILSVQCVEVFFNVYFRILISESAYAHAAPIILADMARTTCGLDRKIKTWPKAVFGKQLPLDQGAGQRFVTLKNLRHKLMHFNSSHEMFSIPGVAIHGLADVSCYEVLSANSAIEALYVAEAFICEVFILRGIREDDLHHELHSWTGRPSI